MHIVNQAQAARISAALELRRKVFALDNDLGVWFAKELSQEWREHQTEGVRSACWSLSQALREIPGVWDLYVAARETARA